MSWYNAVTLVRFEPTSPRSRVKRSTTEPLRSHNYTSKIIPKLVTNNGKIVTDQHEILNETKIFYEDLYASKDSQLIDIDLFELFRNIDTKKINKDESDSIEGPITYLEAALVLRAMSNNRK